MNFAGIAGPHRRSSDAWSGSISFAPLGRVVLREQALVRNLDEVRVAEILLAVAPSRASPLRRSCGCTPRCCGPASSGRSPRGCSARTARPGPGSPTGSCRRRSRDSSSRPAFRLRGVAGEVLVAEQAALLLGELRHRLRDVAFVEAIARRLQRLVPALVRPRPSRPRPACAAGGPHRGS